MSMGTKVSGMWMTSGVCVWEVCIWAVCVQARQIDCFSPNLCYPSMHEGKGIQDLHPLVCKHIELHGDSDADRLDELFCFVPASIGTLQLSCSGTPRWVSGSQSDGQHGLGCGI